MSENNSQPYCKECGYILHGLTESSKCPECGRPIVEVLTRDAFPGVKGYRYESITRLWGLPLVSIASGPSGTEKAGRPIGVIAIGDLPKGIVAIGGRAVGVIAIGGFALGGIALGGFSLGLIAVGGFAAGLAAIGGFAVGGIAIGGFAGFVIHGIGGQVISLWPW